MDRPLRRRRAPRGLHLESLEGRTLLSLTPTQFPFDQLDPSRSVIVRFRDDVVAPTTPGPMAASSPDAARAIALSALGASVAYAYSSGPELLTLAPDVDRAAVLAALRARPDVVYAQPDALVQVAQVPNDPLFGNEWGLNNSNDVDINAPEAWDVTTGSPATIVAVTDTGIDFTHPDLYLAVAVKQSRIPATIRGLPRSGIVDTNSDGQIDLYDLNSLRADGATVVRNAQGGPINAAYTVDGNSNGRIDGADLLSDTQWVTASTDLLGWNFANNNNWPQDDHGHGTHVSGTIAARTNNALGIAGVNWNARIMPMKFIGSNGSGSDSAAIAAIEYAAENGARVINASWGDTGDSPGIADAIRYAGALGTVFVAAAGNNGQNLDSTPFYPAAYHLPTELSVAAVAGGGSISGFSNYSATLVDLGAPGSDIISTTLGGGYGYASGTSMAAPHVAGVVSLVAGLRPDLTPEQLVTLIKSNTKPLSSLVGKTVTGGMLDARRAVVAAQAPASASASFLRSDTITRGSWQGTYGADGYSVVGDATSLPAYAALTPSGQSAWTWAASTADARALRKPSNPADRIAATWYAANQLTIEANITDGQSHAVSLYFLDWDGAGRSERVDVVDPTSGAVLNSQTVSNFSSGQYLTWQVTGRVQFRITRLAGQNAVVSGIFFGTPVASSSGTASYLGADTTSQGNWQTNFGADGYSVVGDATSLPAYAALTPSGQSAWTWAASTADARALRKPSNPADRIAATWYAANQLTIDVNLSGDQAHKVGLYLLDWDNGGRSELIEVLDLGSGAVLDSRTISNFAGGQYLAWQVTGRVQFRITRLAGQNAVVSGIFFGGATDAPVGNAAQFLAQDTATRGSWQGQYGADGYSVLGDTTSLPAYATLTPSGQSSWTWAASTGDTRALRKPSNPADRIAATWFAASGLDVDVNLSDGQSHRVSLYLLDWDGAGRSQRIDVLDASTGAILDTRTVTNFGSGTYMSWQVTGHVVFRLTRLSGPNAVVSGLFFG